MLYKNASKILPVSYPTITSWTWHASLFAMVENVEHAQDWIMSNYIQIQCRPDKEGEKLYFDFFMNFLYMGMIAWRRNLIVLILPFLFLESMIFQQYRLRI